jgi:hypothetical protein
MDDFEDMLFGEGFGELEYNDMGSQSVAELLEYLLLNMNMIVAYSKSTTNVMEKIEFYIKPPHNGGDNNNDDDDNNGGGFDPGSKPLPRRPVEFEMEA